MALYHRKNPFFSYILQRDLLTKPSSSKRTYHLALSLEGSGICYQPGDSLAILPANDTKDAQMLLSAVKATGSEMVHDPRSDQLITFNDYLLQKANLFKSSPALFKKLQERSPRSDKQALLSKEYRSHLSAWLETTTPTKLLSLYPPQSVSLKELTSLLLPMLPRFYSIASSQNLFPSQVHLTVREVSYYVDDELRFGIGSNFLCKRAAIHTTPVPLYIQPAHKFALPEDPEAPIILIGPGTGIAPYRAFLQERLYHQMPGRNWLFFGERNKASDFYYGDYFEDLQAQKKLRLNLAFSRDAKEKVYVQHHMWSERKDLWAWIEEGAYFYICGDAKRMAKDVEMTLHKIAMAEGALSEDAARAKIKQMRAEMRLQTDVY